MNAAKKREQKKKNLHVSSEGTSITDSSLFRTREQSPAPKTSTSAQSHEIQINGSRTADLTAKSKSMQPQRGRE
jgi:hypothetical protein